MKYFNWTKTINKDELKEVKETLINEKIVIFPTETVYGIAASALSDKAIEKLYEAKERPRDKAINIMVSDIEEIEKYALIKNDIERKIIKNFMPGEITIILDKKENFGKGFTKENTIGIRIPDNIIALNILKETQLPLIVSSANLSGHSNGVNPQEINKDFKEKVDIIIDGGIIKEGIPSTIVRVEKNEIKILREGKITKEEIENKINLPM